MGKGKQIKLPRGAKKRDVKTEPTESNEEHELEAIFYDNEEKTIAFLVYLFSAALYVYTMYPGLPGGDSGELMATAKDFGVSHPPGYPLFTTMAALMINLFPVGTTAWKLNLMSSLIGAGTNVLVFLNVKRLTRSDGGALLASGWCGFSRIFWMWNIQGEVFSMSNFFAALIMYVAWRFSNAESKAGKLAEAKIGAFVCGLALTNQHTSVLFIAPTALWVLYTLITWDLAQIESLLKVGLHGLAGLTPYLQLPISSFFFKARVSWGDHRLFSDFKKHLLREDFGTFRLVSSSEQSTLLDNLLVYVNDSSRELTVAVWALFVVGIALAVALGSRQQRETTLVYLAMIITYFAVFGSLANIKNPTGIFHGVLERFWLQPSVCLCTIAGIGIGRLFTEAQERLKCPAVRFFFLSVAAAAIAYQVQHNWTDCNENDNYFFYHYSRHILPHLPRRSILLTSGDFSTNTFRYHTIGEEYRTDVMVMDMQFMQAYWFYICLMPINWPDVSFPGLYKPGKASQYPFYNLRTFLDQNFDRFPTFMCVSVPDAEDSIVGVYEAWPFGMCKRFVRLSDQPDPLQWVEKGMPNRIDLDVSPLPDPDRYEPQTWEYTMMMSMLETYSKPSIFIWGKANNIKDNPGLRKQYYKKAFSMMKENRKYLHDRMENGKLNPNVKYYVSPMEKQLGHLALILHSLSKDPAEKAEVKAAMIFHWTNYVEWHRDTITAKDNMWDTIHSLLRNPDLDAIRVV